jgi:hypothetical protein
MDSSSNNPDSNKSNKVAFFGRTRLAHLKKAGGREQGDKTQGAGSREQGENFLPCPLQIAPRPFFLCQVPSLSIVNRISHTLYFDKWDFYPSISGLKEYIKRAKHILGVDDPHADNAELSIKVKLIKLHFADKNFDLVLKGFLLFAYIDYLNKEFTSPTILKLDREGSRKFRNYTWQSKDVKPHQFMRNLLADLKAAVIAIEVLPVIWEFQKSTKQLMLLTILGLPQKNCEIFILS